jgi:hypothetical protein
MANPQINIPSSLVVDPGLRLADVRSIATQISQTKGQDTQDSITASTTQTQAGGTLLVSAMSRITVANNNDAVTLNFNAETGRTFIIINDSGQTIQLFPKGTDKINDAVASAAVTIADNTYSDYCCPVAGKWFGGATSFET